MSKLFQKQAKKKSIAFFMLTAMWLAFAPVAAIAEPPVPNPAPAPAPDNSGDNCTTSAIYQNQSKTGMITDVVAQMVGGKDSRGNEVKGIITEASERLFKSVTGNPAFKKAVYAAIVLYVIFYGVFFLFGMANLTFGEVLIRLLKIGVITAVISDTGWEFFSVYVKDFFNKGTEDIINAMARITVGAAGGDSSVNGTLVVLDQTVTTIFSMKMFTSVIGSVTTGPYGWIFAGLIIMGMWGYMGAVLGAVWVYLMSYIAKALLFGLAPIFITCLMFQRTKQLFDGWLSQIVNFSLQPIFLFAFLGFYAQLIQESVKAILRTDWCWGCFVNFGVGCLSAWQPAQGTKVAVTYGWDGATALDAATGKPIPLNIPIFPIDIIDVLIFYLLTQMAWKYTHVVVSLAREIANSSVFLSDMSGALAGWFSGMGRTAGAAAMRTFRGNQIPGTRARTVGGLPGTRPPVGKR